MEVEAGRSLMRKSFVYPTWEPRIEDRDFLKLEGASKQQTGSYKVILLHHESDNFQIDVLSKFLKNFLLTFYWVHNFLIDTSKELFLRL